MRISRYEATVTQLGHHLNTDARGSTVARREQLQAAGPLVLRQSSYFFLAKIWQLYIFLYMVYADRMLQEV